MSDRSEAFEELLTRCVLRIEDDGMDALDEFCAAHPEHAARLRARVDDLIDMRLVGADSTTITVPPLAAPRRTPGPEAIGPYRILDVLGEGGMGRVYLAEQKEPVRRRVAIKVIRPDLASGQLLARFELERQALASMNHPAIAKVFEAGTTPAGEPFFVMENVEGVPITTYCDEHKLALEARIELFQQVCRGVQHAHQKGVIHRDLTPRNILVTRREDQHVAKIIDFGLARATDHNLIAQTIYTEPGRIIGTLDYMSPEQVGGRAADIDTRTDVYSLGVVLYELLSGQLPFPMAELRAAGEYEILRVLREEEPTRPSTRVTGVVAALDRAARLRQLSPGTFASRLRGELDWIVMRAIAKEPERRFDSPIGLARDLERYLDGEPVEAGPPSTTYRLRKMVRKHRAVATVGLIAALGLLAGGVATWVQYRRAEREAGHLRVAQARVGRLVDALAALGRQREVLRRRSNTPLATPANLPALRESLRDRQALVAQATALQQALPDLREAAEHDAAQGSTWRFIAAEIEAAVGEMQSMAADVNAVEARIEWAEKVTGATLTSHADAWAAARRAIAGHPVYGGLDLVPQLGLIPLGPDPESGLWEFLHLRSQVYETDAPPSRGADGRWRVRGETGIVFALIPGGTFRMGIAEPAVGASTAPSHRAYPPRPVHEVALTAFFLGKYEVTQAQWIFLSDPRRGFAAELNPSRFAPAKDRAKSYANPVESVSFDEAQALLAAHGLTLPTEAQWEYGCRAGTTWPWSSGAEPGSLDGCANLYDAAVADGFAYHAPVGTYRPNGWGLHDMHGNVCEWTLDRCGPYSAPVAPSTGLRRVADDPDERFIRGGGFTDDSRRARCGDRLPAARTLEIFTVGCRAARRVQGATD